MQLHTLEVPGSNEILVFRLRITNKRTHADGPEALHLLQVLHKKMYMDY